MKTMKRLNIAVAVAVTVLLMGMLESSEAQLQMNFYAKSCPKAEKIISDHIQKHIHNGPSLAAPLIRMHFHDCFVRVLPLIHLDIYVCIYVHIYKHLYPAQ